jgi:predicted Zn-dependent protease with MMP-like domain
VETVVFGVGRKEAVCASEAKVRRQLRATLLHEVGHYYGLSEDELRGL